MAIQYKSSLDHTFHALGDQTRRGILSILATKGPCTANELREPFNVAQPTVSKHLKVLETAGLVRRQVTGRTHHFELITDHMDEAQDWIIRHKKFWEGTLQRLEHFVEDLQNLPETPEENP